MRPVQPQQEELHEDGDLRPVQGGELAPADPNMQEDQEFQFATSGSSELDYQVITTGSEGNEPPVEPGPSRPPETPSTWQGQCRR